LFVWRDSEKGQNEREDQEKEGKKKAKHNGGIKDSPSMR
jgi:hypothetical protein